MDKSMKFSKIAKWWWHVIRDHWALPVVIILVILLVYRFATPFSALDDEGLVIAFLGVLATFIVVGNFSQTNTIKEDLTSRMNRFEIVVSQKLENDKKQWSASIKKTDENTERIGKLETSKESITNQINEFNVSKGTLNGRVERLETTLKDYDKLTNNVDANTQNIQTFRNQIDYANLLKLLKLFVGEESDVRKNMQLYARLFEPTSVYHILLKDGGRYFVTITLEGDALAFYTKKNEKLNKDEIQEISGVKFNEDNLKFAYDIIHNQDVKPSSKDEEGDIAKDLTHAEETKSDTEGHK